MNIKVVEPNYEEYGHIYINDTHHFSGKLYHLKKEVNKIINTKIRPITITITNRENYQ